MQNSVFAVGLVVVASMGFHTPVRGISPPNTSLATIPVGYFGGNYLRRGDANIEMLSKMRIVMIEKWEGHCWQDCLNNSGSPACTPSCGVEDLIMDTARRVKALNPSVCAVMYLNTLLDFPFYRLHGNFEKANALTIDSSSREPIRIRNDNGMEGIYVFGFDKPAGVEIYIDAIKNLTKSGVIDGFFGDKWDKGAEQSRGGQWQICNHECGNVTEAQGVKWNAGKLTTLESVTQYVGKGPYFANGVEFEGCASNFNGHWGGTQWLRSGDPRDGVVDVQTHLANYSYFYVSSTGDQHWTTDPNDPASLVGTCDGECMARFLLAVEEGAFLGTNGWLPEYGYPLGNPLGPAVYTASHDHFPATLHRNFSSGTFVIFTYDSSGKDGKGVVYWGGHAPPPPPPPPTITCNRILSTVMNGTTFAQDDIVPSNTAHSAQSCCNECSSNSSCIEWAWHGDSDMSCHLHGAQAVKKAKKGVVSGVMQR